MYAIGIALLAFVVHQNWEPNEAGVGLKMMLMGANRWWCFLPAAAFLASNVALTFVRWHYLVRAQDLPFSLKDAFRLGLVGYYFNTFLPGSVGGDVLKAAFLTREQTRRTVAVSTVMIDRGVGLWGMIALAAIFGGGFWLAGDPIIAAQPTLRNVVRAAAGFMAFTLTLWAVLGFLPDRRADRFATRLLWFPVVGKVMAEFWRAVWIYRKRTPSLMVGLLYSIAGHSLNVFAFYFAALAFQPREAEPNLPSLIQHFVLVPAGMGFQAFIPTPGGMGAGEAAFAELYKSIGYARQGGIFGIFGWRLCNWVLGAIGFIAYSFMKRDLDVIRHTSIDSSSPDGKSSTTHVR